MNIHNWVTFCVLYICLHLKSISLKCWFWNSKNIVCFILEILKLQQVEKSSSSDSIFQIRECQKSSADRYGVISCCTIYNSTHIALFTKAHLAKWSFGDLKWLYLVVKQYVQSVPKSFYKSLSNKQTYNNNTTFIERYHSAVEKTFQ